MESLFEFNGRSNSGETKRNKAVLTHRTPKEPWQISTSRNSPVCVIFDADERMRIISFRNITEVVTRMTVY